MTTIYKALSALQTESNRLAVSAGNVANATSLGFARQADGTGNGGFQPLRLHSVSLPGGGVTGRALPIDPASVKIFQPDNPDADSEGLVPIPNFDLGQEFVTQLLAKRAYQAAAHLVREEDERFRETLSLLS